MRATNPRGASRYDGRCERTSSAQFPLYRGNTIIRRRERRLRRASTGSWASRLPTLLPVTIPASPMGSRRGRLGTPCAGRALKPRRVCRNVLVVGRGRWHRDFGAAGASEPARIALGFARVPMRVPWRMLFSCLPTIWKPSASMRGQRPRQRRGAFPRQFRRCTPSLTHGSRASSPLSKKQRSTGHLEKPVAARVVI